MILEFTAPTRPLSINEANRMHWATRRRRLQPWALCTANALAACAPQDRAEVTNRHCTVEVTIAFERNARRDPHNYVSTVVKTIVDALVRGGMVPDDTAEWITVKEPAFLIDKTQTVRIVVRPTNPEEK